MRRGANRVRNVEWAEEEAYREHEHRERDRIYRELVQTASADGYRYPGPSWAPPQFYQCPTCGALTSLNGVVQHTGWHRTGGTAA